MEVSLEILFMRGNERLIMTSAALNRGEMFHLGKDSESRLLNEPVVAQHWGPDFLASVCGLIDNKGAILILFAGTICYRTELILCVSETVGLYSWREDR